MTLRHLEIFKVVAETGNFTKAAKKLFLSQSGVSHAIRELEEEAGTLLFERLAKKVALTESGKVLLKESLPILAACNALGQRMGSLEKTVPLHIVSCITIANFWLPDLLKKMKEEWPQTPVKVQVVTASRALDILERGEADVALIEGHAPQGPFMWEKFSAYSLKAVCAPGYSLETKELTLEALCRENLLLREKGSAIRDTLDGALRLAGYVAEPLWESVNSPALIEAAKAGLGIAVLPEVLIKEPLEKGELIAVDIEGQKLTNDLTMVHHRDKYISAQLQWFLEHCKN